MLPFASVACSEMLRSASETAELWTWVLGAAQGAALCKYLWMQDIDVTRDSWNVLWVAGVGCEKNAFSNSF